MKPGATKRMEAYRSSLRNQLAKAEAKLRRVAETEDVWHHKRMYAEQCVVEVMQKIAAEEERDTILAGGEVPHDL